MDIVEHKGKRLYRWEVGASTFLVDIENGAKLLAWDISIAGKKRDVLYFQEDSLHCGNPILFPFAGTSSLKGERFKWQSPQGDVLDMPQHGFAKDAKFEILNIGDEGFCARLIQEDSFAKYYPYDYDFYVNYSFDMFSFKVELRLENKGDLDMPWAAGNHFYFNVPWHEGRTRADYVCNINAKSAFFYKDCKLEKVESLKLFDLANASQINVLHTNMRSPELSFCSKNGEENVTIKINDSLDKNSTIVTWTQSEDSPFYCIEPWMGLANAAEHKKGLHILKAHSTQSFSVEVSL